METRQRSKYHTGLFQDKTSAEAAYKSAIKRGYQPKDITILMSEETRKKYYGSDTTLDTGEEIIKTEEGDKSMEGLALGGALGGTVIGTLGALVALSTTIAIPGLGLVIAGPLAAGLVGAGAGSIAGGLLGALIGAGIPEEHAKIYEKGIKEGGIVVGVKSNPTYDNELIEDWKTNYKGKDVF